LKEFVGQCRRTHQPCISTVAIIPSILVSENVTVLS